MKSECLRVNERLTAGYITGGFVERNAMKTTILSIMAIKKTHADRRAGQVGSLHFRTRHVVGS